MANSKVILNGSTLMDVTTDTVAASNLLSGNTATKNDGTKVTGVYVPPSYSTQSKTGIVPTESSQSITPDAGYDGLSLVQINGISSTYVGTGVARKSSGDLTASGSTITAPAGYYSTAASKSIAAGSAFTPAVTITANPGITVNANGLITATVGASSKITPTVTAGYVAAGTSGTVSATGTQTSQLTSVAATTYNVSTADRTIASQRWLVGAQTIKSVTTANIAAANIKDGVTITVGDANDADRIAGVTGTFTDAATVSTGQQAATADKILNGFSAWVDGAEVKGTYTSAEGYTLTTIVPQQSVTVNSSRQGSLTNVSGTITDGEYYLVTYDGVQYITTCNVLWTNNAVIGDCAWCTGTTNDYIYPFAVDQVTAGTVLFAATASSQHTIKIEHLELNGGASTLIPKTVTAPGTYNASADSADGYSQVTVSLATQAAQTIYPSTAAQTIASQKWLTGAQTIAAVTTSNLVASNIMSGVTVKVGDAANASRIIQVVGTATGGGSSFFQWWAENTSEFHASDTAVVSYFKTIGSIRDGAFFRRRFDGSFEFTNASVVGSFAFAWGSRTGVGGSATLSFPACTQMNQYAFGSMLTSVSIYASSLSVIENNAFYNAGVAYISAPSCTSIGSSVFFQCTRLSAVYMPSVSIVGSYAFAGCSSLASVSFPVCTSIGTYGFSGCGVDTASFPECTKMGTSAFALCYSLTNASFPKLASIENYTFSGCNELTQIYAPVATSIGGNAFNGCWKLATVSVSMTTFIGSYAFTNCSMLSSVSFPEVITVSIFAFSHCSRLVSVSLPKVVSVHSSAFHNCSALSNVYMPLCELVGANAFVNDIAISTLSLPACKTISTNAFSGCAALESLYLTGSSVPSLVAANVFGGTPMSVSTIIGHYGSIYVPSSLVATYKAAANWSLYKDRFVGV